MKNNIIKYFFLILGVGFFGCKGNVDLSPISSIDSAAGFATKSDLDAAITGCYSSLLSANSYGLRYWVLAEMNGDNIAEVGTFADMAEVFNKIISTNNASVTNMWVNMYSGINRLNNVIASAPKVAANDKAVVSDVYVGEARCLRGFQYFNLLRFWGGSETGYNKTGGLGVPLVLKPTLALADTASTPRSSEADVWKAIVDDLTFAAKNLPAKNGTGKVNSWVANALLARAYLYMGDWANAEATADNVIKNGGYSLLASASYPNIFATKNTAESIWELQFDSQTAGSAAFFYFTTGLGGRNEISSSASLNAAHETGDVRKPVNYTVATASIPAAKTLKYTHVDGTDNVIQIRLAELYLIRAEARANQSKFVDALVDVNIIRARAGLTPSIAATQADLLLAIEKERRIELAHEGHRWFDLRRYNKTSTLGVTQGFRNLWPIPDREVTTSGGIIAQNPGY